MPYIKAKERDRIHVNSSLIRCSSPGELNYAICQLAINYLNDREMSYTTLNDIIGAMEGAKLEFVRRVVNKYEDHKISENGDIFRDIIRIKNI